MNRLQQTVLLLCTILGSWWAMQAIHESGHVIGAWATGGQVERVILDPLTFSRTDLAHNPSPLFVAWAGPVVGVVAPVLLWALAAAMRLRAAFLLRFLAGFCLVANGAYLGLGSLHGVGDCGEMLRFGSSRWQLWLFALVATPAGLWLWHGQGSHFGLGAGQSCSAKSAGR